MQNLPKNLTEVRVYLSRIRPWAAVAGLCAAVLLGFYTLQGIEYWEAWKQSRDMTVEIDRITSKLDRGVPNNERAVEDLALQQQRLEYLRSVFEYPDVARLMGIVSTTSWDTGVDLPSISAGDPLLKEVNGMEYRTQVLTLTARGPVRDMYRFLASLHEKVKVVSVPSISIANPSGDEASAQIQLIFYLSPQSISDKDGAD
jgi:hypothetical protein